jgi:integration host factor subunit beta
VKSALLDDRKDLCENGQEAQLSVLEEEELMTRSELGVALANRQGMTQKKAEAVVGTIFEAMAEALGSGDRIEVRGFGSFAIREYRPYTGRNPKTGESIAVKPKKLPYFKAGKELRENLASNF